MQRIGVLGRTDPPPAAVRFRAVTRPKPAVRRDPQRATLTRDVHFWTQFQQPPLGATGNRNAGGSTGSGAPASGTHARAELC